MIRLFRPARAAHPLWNLTKTLLQTAVFWSTLLWLAPAALVSGERLLGVGGIRFAGQLPVGWLVLVVASFGGLWSGLTMALHGHGTPLPLDTAQRLVTGGPYRFVRNPMAVFGLSQGLGVAILHGSPTVLLYVLAGAILWHVTVRPVEERELANRFGAAYDQYRARVPLWLPRLRAAA